MTTNRYRSVSNAQIWETPHIRVFATTLKVCKESIINMTLYVPGYEMINVAIDIKEWKYRRRQWGRLFNFRKISDNQTEFFYHIKKDAA